MTVRYPRVHLAVYEASHSIAAVFGFYFMGWSTPVRARFRAHRQDQWRGHPSGVRS